MSEIIPNKISNFLSTLTSGKSFAVFFVCLLLGAFSIFFNFEPIFVTAIVVSIYTAILWLVQNYYKVVLAPSTKNTPYFLGFLFTLIALYETFITLPYLTTDITQYIQSSLIPNVGTALLSTIVGLIGRQLIVSYDPAYEESEKLFALATDELKDNIYAYRTAQQKLLDLVEEFTESHKVLVQEEQDATKQHIAMLSESSTALTKLGRQYPPKVQKLIDSFDKIQMQFDEYIKEGLPDIQKQLLEETKSFLEDMHNNFVKSAGNVFEKMDKSLEGLQVKIDKFNSSFTIAFEKFPEIQARILKESADQLESFQDSFIIHMKNNLDDSVSKLATIKNNLNMLASSFKECNSIMDDGFKDSFAQIENHLSSLSKSIGSTNQSINLANENTNNSMEKLNQHFVNIDSQMNKYNELNEQKLSIFGKEIKEIDNLIESFLTITKKRLSLND